MLVWAGADKWAYTMTSFLPSYDTEAICNRMKGRVFTGTWAICAVIGSTTVATAMLLEEIPAILLMSFGVILICTQSAVQSYKHFRDALLELCLPWPPTKTD